MAIESKDLLVAIKAFSRGEALPLDASEVQDSYESATSYATSATAYAGQTIKALVNGKYCTYVLQPKESGDGYELEEVGVKASQLKTYIQIVSELPSSGQEQGVLYINTTDNKGYIYNGTSYQVVFEEVETLAADVANLKTSVQSNKDAIDTINGSGEGSISKALADAKSYTDEKVSAVETTLASKADKDSVYTTTQTDAKIAAAIGSAGHLKRLVVEALPAAADADVDIIYMVAKVASTEEGNIYDEYMVFEADGVKKFEKIGDTAVSLADYATKAEVSTAKQEAIDAAATDATSKANSAKETAITTAAADATEKANAALATAEAYADEKDAANLAAAKEYASGLADNYDAKGAADTALAEAKAYAVEQDTSSLDAAKAYTNSKIDTVNTVLNTKVTASDVTSAISARVGDIDASTTVKDYIDTAIGSGGTSSAEAIAKAKKEAIEASQEYTDTALTITEF